ncbi:hypothetical protein [Dysgonomonas sp. Marseille-P4361]|uniref:hypothetical protein n=1 Tax=Dysgonomonas sp. Marseille-P4361 TaxID=2161820 RepID=UPI000D55E2F8|nr:hypothetical protein [Dysgonomonas sp. Marseille-P4361]
MEKSLFTLALLCLLFKAGAIQAQVSIGTNNPPQKFSILEIHSEATHTGGLRLPQLTEDDKNGMNTKLLESLEKSKGLTIFNIITGQIEFWDGEKWVAAKTIEPWMTSGTNKIATSNTDNIYQMGLVTIGDPNNIDPTAIFNVVSKNKGVLLPRIELSGPTDIVTIPNPTTGLLIYNTGANSAFPVEGYLYWNGKEWRQFVSGTSKNPQISGLDCINARMNPVSYKAGEQYEGVLIVPYFGGNGGYYGADLTIESTGVTGLTATLQPGNLAYGNGEMIFNLSGIPSESSPELATFEIDFAGNVCSASVGANSLKQGEIEYWHGTMLASERNVLVSDFVEDMPIIEDALRLDAYFDQHSNGDHPISFIPRIYNVSNKPVKYSWGGVTSVEGRGRGNVILAPGGYQDLDNGMYMGYGENMMMGISTPDTSMGHGVTSQETMTIDLFYSGRWYRVFFTGWVDNKNTKDKDDADNTREVYITYQRLY